MLNNTIKLTASFLCKNFLQNPLSILIYHRVLNQKDPMRPDEITAEEFDCQMATVAEFFNVLPLPLAVNLLKSNKLPPRSLCITFDDGYADNYTTALPILKKHNLEATFFVSTGFLDGGTMWNDLVIEGIRNVNDDILVLSDLDIGIETLDISNNRLRLEASNNLLNFLKYLPINKRIEKIDSLFSTNTTKQAPELMMLSSQVRALDSAGMTIGAHTVNHPILSAENHANAQREIANGKEELETIIRNKVNIFAYPNGMPGKDYFSEHVGMVKNLGFSAAVTTAWGTSTNKSDLFQLPRFTPWDKNKYRFSLRLMQNCLLNKAITV